MMAGEGLGVGLGLAQGRVVDGEGEGYYAGG